MLEDRAPSTLIAFGPLVTVSRLFGVGRRLLSELEFPEPWAGHLTAKLIDDLEFGSATWRSNRP